MSEPRLVSILWKVLNTRFERSLHFFFGWQAHLPILIVTKKQLLNFAHEFCDHSVYETAKTFELYYKGKSEHPTQETAE